MAVKCKVLIQKVEESTGKGAVISPTRNHEDDAGFDLYNNLESPKILYPGETFMCPTGIRMAIQRGFYGKIEARSGWASKRNMLVPCGVVDCGYRGEVHVVLYNRGEERQIISPNDRIGQIVFHELPEVDMETVGSEEELPSSSRMESGYGSSGW